MAKEKNLHLAVCDYLRMQYPSVIFTSDMSGIRVSIGVAIQMKKMRSGNGVPDLIILEPKIVIKDGETIQYNALLLELKREGTRVWLKDGSVTTDPHISEQYTMLNELNKRGYFATIVCGFDEAKAVIDKYLRQ